LTYPARWRKGKIKEFLDYNGGSGIQHIAFQVDDIIAVIERMRERGVEFLEIPQTYYKLLKLRLGNSDLEVKEDLNTVRIIISPFIDLAFLFRYNDSVFC